MLYEHGDLYDEQYQHYRDDLFFYGRLADDYGSPVLEIGAGSARVSMALAKKGHYVQGIDLSAHMLARGQQRLAGHNLTDYVQLTQADMRDFDLQTQFPLIIAPFNSLAHAYSLQDQDATFTNVIKHLAPGGLFALDLFNPHFGSMNVLRRETEWQHVGDNSSELFLVQSHDAAQQIIETTYFLDSVLPDGTLKRKTARLRQRYFTRFELERALRQAGFGQLQFFGGFDKQPYTPEAHHLIVLARLA